MRVVIHYLIIKFLPVELGTLQRPNFGVFAHEKRKRKRKYVSANTN